jgi:hypothetical protein
MATHPPKDAMPALVAGIHVHQSGTLMCGTTWMPVSSTGMTIEFDGTLSLVSRLFS